MRAFVYGTLTDPDRVASVVETFEFEGDAVLSGLHRVDGRYPTLAPGGQTAGRLLSTPDAAALDAYEGVDRGLYVRETVPGPGGRVAVYVGDPERLGVDERSSAASRTGVDGPAPVSWPGEGPFEERVRRYLRDASVRVQLAE